MIGDDMLRCLVITGKSKDEQPLAPFKKAFGDSLSDWPQVTRKECLCMAPAKEGEAQTESAQTDFQSFTSFFESYYAGIE